MRLGASTVHDKISTANLFQVHTLSAIFSSLDSFSIALTSSSVREYIAFLSSLLDMWLACITVANTGKPFDVFSEPS